jgi:uncharacterized membrane protein
MPSPTPLASAKSPRRPRLTPHFKFRHTGEYLLRGILVIAPIFITLSFVYWAFRKLDGLFYPYVIAPGLGFILLIVGVLLVGWISTFYVVKRTFRLVGHGIELTPGISFIYTSVRDFFEAFVGNKRRFTHAVLVSVTMDDVWLVGFLTDEKLASFNLEDEYVSVYVPQAYNVAGQLYIVKRERIRPIEHLASTDVMKYAVTGGAVVITEK